MFNATGTNIDYSAFFPGFGFTKEQKPLFNAFVASFAGNTDVVKALAMVRTTWQNSKQHLESDGVSYNPIDCPTTQQLQNIGNNSAD